MIYHETLPQELYGFSHYFIMGIKGLSTDHLDKNLFCKEGKYTIIHWVIWVGRKKYGSNMGSNDEIHIFL